MTCSARTLRILLVDDDTLIRLMLTSLLKILGAEVVAEAANGKEAVSAYATHKPDLTFLDIQMPVKNGFDALREIKRLDAGANVIMLTANDDTVVAESCINAGARTYIKKGGSPDELKTVLKRQLESFDIL